MYSTGSPTELNFTPWNLLGRNPADHWRAAIGCIWPPLPGRHQHHEARQILRFRAQPVEHPRSHAGPAGDDRAGVHQRVRGIVIDLLGPHGAHDADIVGDAADVRKQLADLLAGFAELLEVVLRSEADQLRLPCSCAICWPLVNDSGMGLPFIFGELGLVVEGFQMRRAAGLIEEDDALGFGG